MYHNEVLFFLQIVIIGLFLCIFGEKKYELLLHQVVEVLFISINLLSSYEVVIFSFHATAIEPCGIGMYFLSILLYRFNKENGIIMLKNLYYINFFLLLILLNIFFFVPVFVSSVVIILKSFIYNLVISLISLTCTYFLERKIYDQLSLRFSSPYSESLAVSASQLFDTLFYSFFVFYHRPIYIIFHIICFSFFIKILCISSYTIFLLYKK